MSFEKQFEDLIEAGKNVIDTDFDPVAFQHWRTHAASCISELMAYDHANTRYFSGHLHEPKKNNLLGRRGLLTASSHELLTKFHGRQRSAKRNSLECDPDVEPRAPKGVRRVNGTNSETQFPYRRTSNGKSLRARPKRRNKI